MTFDYAAFKQGWRKLAATHGFDPVEGPTSYQIALVKAARPRPVRPLDWAHYETATANPAEGARDSVEAAAWTNLNQEAIRRKHDDVVPVDIETLRALWPDAVAAERNERAFVRYMQLPLPTRSLEPALELG